MSLNKKSLKNKLPTLYFYPKQYIRSNLEQENLTILDNYTSTFNKTVTSFDQEKGLSMVYNKIKLQNKKDSLLKFYYFWNPSSQTPAILTSHVYKPLINSINLDSKRASIFLLNTVKGGYTIYYRGIVGFLPYNQFQKLIPIVFNVQSQNIFKNLDSKIFWSYFLSHRLKNFGAIRIPVPLKFKISLHSFTRNSVFSKSKSNSFNLKFNKNPLNIVFIVSNS